MLQRKDIDAVIVGTGEFQRVLPCIHACQAGKDIYAEKPLTLYIREGRMLVDAVRKHDRVFQVGTQQRSMAINRIACEFVRSGGLGKVLEVRAVNYAAPELSPRLRPPPNQSPRTRLGSLVNQAAMRPYNHKWMGWMRWRDFGGGEMTNWGAHGVDQIQWALGMDGTGPVELWPIEGVASGVACSMPTASRSNSCSTKAHGRCGVCLRAGKTGNQSQQGHVESTRNRHRVVEASRRRRRRTKVE